MFSTKNIKIGLSLIFFLFFYFSISKTFAVYPNAFVIEIQPSSFEVNQSVDLVVKAVNNGEIIKDYIGDVFIEVDGDITSEDYIVPSEGLYSFLPQDQGIKIFSKGLQVKKTGTFKVKIEDIVDAEIRGEATIIVGTINNEDVFDIQITSPVPGVIEKNDVVNVFGMASQLPNSPIQYYLNSVLVDQGLTDTIGSFSTYLTGVSSGENILKVKIIDGANTVLGESTDLTFNYSPITDGIFKGIEVLPSGEIKQGDQVTFNVRTSDSITSVELKFSDGKSYPMDRLTAGEFTKKVSVDSKGTIVVSLEMMDAGNKKEYSDVHQMLIEEGTNIKNIKFYTDLIDINTLTVKREVVGVLPVKFKVDYGTSKDNLDQSANVDTNEIFVDNIDMDTVYYFKITPLDSSLSAIGSSSDVVSFNPAGPTCIVKDIQIFTGKIGDKYYLMRSGIENVDKYIIYRSEFETSDISNMQKVLETSDTKFEYPFDKFSKINQYAFYVVEAVCKDGTTLKIDNVKKVQVGPMENILMIILFSIFCYSIYKLYRHAK
ncbi:hypothetical protein K9M48_04090 [Candidatus Gracilibacteria bacterium]|nr:hypothetical protein [Candidatus Gracilibacteria bacterium]